MGGHDDECIFVGRRRLDNRIGGSAFLDLALDRHAGKALGRRSQVFIAPARLKIVQGIEKQSALGDDMADELVKVDRRQQHNRQIQTLS